MNYIGSKYSIIDFLHSSIQKTLELHGEEKSPADMVFADLFAGTGMVGAYFREQGFSVIANDIQYYSYVICRHLIEGAVADGGRCAELLSELNALEGREGFIYKNYSYGGTEGQEFRRMYFSDENAKIMAHMLFGQIQIFNYSRISFKRTMAWKSFEESEILILRENLEAIIKKTFNL